MIKGIKKICKADDQGKLLQGGNYWAELRGIKISWPSLNLKDSVTKGPKLEKHWFVSSFVH